MTKVKKMAFGGLGGAVQRKPIGPPTSLPSRPGQSVERKPIGPGANVGRGGRGRGGMGNMIPEMPLPPPGGLQFMSSQFPSSPPPGAAPATVQQFGSRGGAPGGAPSMGPSQLQTMKKGGSASSRADGIAVKGKTRGKLV